MQILVVDDETDVREIGNVLDQSHTRRLHLVATDADQREGGA